MGNDIGSRLHLAGFDLPAPDCEDLQEGKRLLHPVVTVDVQHDRLGIAVLGENQRFSPISERPNDLLGVIP